MRIEISEEKHRILVFGPVPLPWMADAHPFAQLVKLICGGEAVADTAVSSWLRERDRTIGLAIPDRLCMALRKPTDTGWREELGPMSCDPETVRHVGPMERIEKTDGMSRCRHCGGVIGK